MAEKFYENIEKKVEKYFRSKEKLEKKVENLETGLPGFGEFYGELQNQQKKQAFLTYLKAYPEAKTEDVKKAGYMDAIYLFKGIKSAKKELKKGYQTEEFPEFLKNIGYLRLQGAIYGSNFYNDEALKRIEKGQSVKEALIGALEHYSSAQVKEKFDNWLTKLSSREEHILKLRYGIDREQKTLKQIGEEISRTPERIRQIEIKAERKLRLYDYRERKLEKERKEGFEQSGLDERLKKILSRDTDQLELSIRASNCLKAANIKTIGELVKKTERDMLKYRNFGRKSLDEIKCTIQDMGLKFGMKAEDMLSYHPKQYIEAKESLDERLNKILSKSTDELELSIRASNCLKAANIKKISELVRHTEQDMLKYRYFGRKSLNELKDVLVGMGLRFGMKIE